MPPTGPQPSKNNPFRDVAVFIEIGIRARDALMTPEDWRYILTIFADQDRVNG